MGVPVGAFEAKAQLSRLLRAVERGEHFTITVRGKPVADLVPTGLAESSSTRAAVEALLALKKVKGVADAEVAAFIAEGRR